MDSIVGTPSRLSLGFENRSELRLKRVTQTPAEFKITDLSCDSNDDAEAETPRAGRGDFIEAEKFGDLQNIAEETDAIASDSVSENRPEVNDIKMCNGANARKRRNIKYAKHQNQEFNAVFL